MISESIESFFGITIKHKSISGYNHRNGYYLWDSCRWAYVETNLFSKVQEMWINPDDTWTAIVGVYQDLNDYGPWNDNDPDHVEAKSIRYYPETTWPNDMYFEYIGTVQATIQPIAPGEWILIDYKVESMY